VQKILVDRGQLVLELRLEVVNDLCVAFHGFSFRFKSHHFRRPARVRQGSQKLLKEHN
jgi:hypothetical protein